MTQQLCRRCRCRWQRCVRDREVIENRQGGIKPRGYTPTHSWVYIDCGVCWALGITELKNHQTHITNQEKQDETN